MLRSLEARWRAPLRGGGGINRRVPLIFTCALESPSGQLQYIEDTLVSAAVPASSSEPQARALRYERHRPGQTLLYRSTAPVSGLAM